MFLWLSLVFKPLYLWLTDANYRAYQWLLIRFGDIKDDENQVVYARSFRLEVNRMQSFLNRFQLFFVQRLALFKSPTGRDALVLDLNAAEGLSPAFFSEAYPNLKIYCWEPESAQRELLVKNMESSRYKKVELPELQSLQELPVWMNNQSIEQIDLLKLNASDLGFVEEERLRNTRHLIMYLNQLDQLPVLLLRLQDLGFSTRLMPASHVNRPLLKPFLPKEEYYLLAQKSL